MTDASTRQYPIRVNGQDCAVNNVPVQTTLLDFLREHGLTGAKEGCAEGRAVNSCLLLAPA